MKYEAVIFDLFGTLVDDLVHPEYQRVEYRRMMKKMNDVLSVSEEDFRPIWSALGDKLNTGFFPSMEAALEHICDELGVDVDGDKLSKAAQVRFEFIRQALIPRHDSVKALIQLRTLGYKIGLISDCTKEVSVLWPDTQFARFFDAAILSCLVGVRKPDPQIYDLACEQLKVIPRKCLYVGDGGSQELTGASRAGMGAVLIRTPYDDSVDSVREEWQGTRVSSVREVLQVVG